MKSFSSDYYHFVDNWRWPSYCSCFRRQISYMALATYVPTCKAWWSIAVYISQGINILIPDYTTSFPKGDRASFASRKCIFPNGMPMMVIISIRRILIGKSCTQISIVSPSLLISQKRMFFSSVNSFMRHEDSKPVVKCIGTNSPTLNRSMNCRPPRV